MGMRSSIKIICEGFRSITECHIYADTGEQSSSFMFFPNENKENNPEI